MIKASKLTRAISIATLTGLMSVAAAVAFTACDDTQKDDKGSVITKYDATLDAVVSMGNNTVNFTENLIDGVYVTEKNGKNDVTVSFKSGEVAMPYNNKMTGIINAAKSTDHFGNEVVPVFGYYNGETLVTEGVVLTYTSDNDFVTVGGANTYYVKSMSFSSDELVSSYNLSLYVTAFNDTAASGMQFPYTSSGGSVTNVELKLDLESGKTVQENGLGVSALGTAPAVYVKYEAELDASITMGPMGTYNLGEKLLDGAYITAKNGSYSLCLILKEGEITVAGITGAVYADDNPANPTETNGITDGTFGAYGEDGKLVTEGVVLTYSSGDNYTTDASGAKVYYVQSVSMPVDSVRESYELAIYINSAMMGKQFSNDSYKATLTLDTESGEAVKEISGLGVDTLGTVPEEPEEATITKYDAELSCFVNAMGGMEFGGVLDSVYVSEANGKYTVTVILTESAVNVMGRDYPTCITDVSGEIGYYDGDELVTEVELTYSTGSEYVEIKTGSYPNQITQEVYYVKSMSFVTDSLEDTYNLALFLGSSAMSAQFDKESSYNAILTIDLESGEVVEEISGLGVPTRGTVTE